MGHPFIMVVALGEVILFPWLVKCQKRLNINWQTALAIANIHGLIGLPVTAKLMSIIEDWDIFTPIKYRIYGPVFILPLFYWLWAKQTKRKVSTVFDAFSILMCLNLAVARVLCIAQDCCGGTVISGTDMAWPIREIEILFQIIFVCIYAGKVLKGKTKGEVYPVYMIYYGVVRFLLEWFREEYTFRVGIFNIAHIWSTISILIGIAILYAIARGRKSSEKKLRKGKSKV